MADERNLIFYHYALTLFLGRPTGDGASSEAFRALESFELSDDWGSCTFAALMIARMGVPRGDWRDNFVRGVLLAAVRYDDDDLHRACGLALVRLEAQDELRSTYQTAESGSRELECLGAVLDHMKIPRPARADDEVEAA